PIVSSAGAGRRVPSPLPPFHPDVIHAHEPLTPSTSMLAVLAASAPVVATFHAALDRSRLMELAAPALRQGSGRIDAAVAVSDAAASFLRRVGRVPLEIAPTGVDVGAFAPRGRPIEGLPAGPKILWANRLDPQKGFEIMLRAFERVASEVVGAHLPVAGDGRDRALLRSLPADLRSRILRLGTVAHGDLPRYHAAADVFVSPATGLESFGIVLVEAMAAGVPVVASDIAGYREVVRDGVDGLLVPPADANALAAAIHRVLSEPELPATLAAAGRTRAETFSWQAVAPRLEAVYDRVIGATR